MTVVDLGAAPGTGLRSPVGILTMNSIPDVTFIQGKFNEDAVFARILDAIGKHPEGLVISDLAPI
ncbi:23S rRNA U2552 (ribose-2'-O)-methylase RlmE/FtsJ [Metapseudomonas resinovorans]